MRDPFSDAFTSKDSGSGPRPDSHRRKQTLEQFPLDSLDMVGTIGRGGGMVGLVVAPDKVVYRIQPGVYMGQNDGRVTAVHEDRIELVELVPDGAGGRSEEHTSELQSLMRISYAVFCLKKKKFTNSTTA